MSFFLRPNAATKAQHVHATGASAQPMAQPIAQPLAPQVAGHAPGTIRIRDHAVAFLVIVLGGTTFAFAYRSATDRREVERLREQDRLLGSELTRLESALGTIRTLTRNADSLASGAAIPGSGKNIGDPLGLNFAAQDSLGFARFSMPARSAPGRDTSDAGDSDLERFRTSVAKIDGLSRDADAVSRRLKNLSTLLQQDQGLLRRVPSMRPVNGRIASGFGYRLSPFEGKKTMHAGIDLAVPIGTAVKAPADGKVTFTGNFETLGRTVVLQHGGVGTGILTRYGHLSKIVVADGQVVKRGDVIALVGSSGKSTGPHLHYEVWVKGQATDPRDFFFDLMSTPEQKEPGDNVKAPALAHAGH